MRRGQGSGWFLIIGSALILGFFAFILTVDLNNVLIKMSNNSSSQKTHIIEIYRDGFYPNSIKINKGDTVVFINKDSLLHWPASDPHTTHSGYPGSSRTKCATEASKIFDACRGLAKEERYSFQFNEIGTWGFHDHINPELKGVITVR